MYSNKAYETIELVAEPGTIINEREIKELNLNKKCRCCRNSECSGYVSKIFQRIFTNNSKNIR